MKIEPLELEDQERHSFIQEEEHVNQEALGNLPKQSYFELLRTNRPFRMYMMSYLVTEMGFVATLTIQKTLHQQRWLTYIASISVVQKLHPGSSIRITILIILRQLPNLLMSAFGGILADSRDRRTSMICLDLIGSIVALLYILVLKTESLPLLYVLSFLQQSISALYEPVRTAIIPMLVTDEEGLRKANTLTGLSWSLMTAVGAAAGGFTTALLGAQDCFLLDSVTYATSAFLMWLVGGKWDASDSTDLQKSQSMWVDGFVYIKQSAFGPLVLLKASGSIIWGAFDVLNVSFSRVEGDMALSNERLGIIFSFVGVGCLLGPIFCDNFMNVEKAGSLQMLCIASIGTVTVSCMGMGYFSSFYSICVLTVLRCCGSSTLWIYSSLILQKFCDNEVLGRVTAIEYAVATLCNAVSALFAGIAQDNLNLSQQQLSWILAILGGVLSFLWVSFHVNGGGLMAIN